jgi:hypothetical protein
MNINLVGGGQINSSPMAMAPARLYATNLHVCQDFLTRTPFAYCLSALRP